MFNSWFFWSFLKFSNNNFLNLCKTINTSARQVMLYIHQDSALLITACMYVFLWKSFEGTSIVHCLFICCIEGRYWKIQYETRAITMFRRCHDEFSVHETFMSRIVERFEQPGWHVIETCSSGPFNEKHHGCSPDYGHVWENLFRVSAQNCDILGTMIRRILNDPHHSAYRMQLTRKIQLRRRCAAKKACQLGNVNRRSINFSMKSSSTTRSISIVMVL